MIRSDRGPGPAAVSKLVCRAGEERATGPVARRAGAARLCTRTRLLVSLLRTKPPAQRVCTQIYGGPQTVRITGTIDGRSVDRTFTRTDGCAIKEYHKVSQALAL